MSECGLPYTWCNLQVGGLVSWSVPWMVPWLVSWLVPWLVPWLVQGYSAVHLRLPVATVGFVTAGQASKLHEVVPESSAQRTS